MNFYLEVYCFYIYFCIGDWGLGIGDWANPQIPNPQSPNIFINSHI